MTFPQSIAHGFANYANFRGRDKRAAFWWWALFNFLVSAAAGILDGAFGSEFVASLAHLVLLLPTLAYGARRLHDIGRNGWWQLLLFLPVIGWAFLVWWWTRPSKEDDSPPAALSGPSPEAPLPPPPSAGDE